MVAPETPLDDAAQSPLRAGDVLVGKYRVERQIGRGGMGIVLAATHLQLEHQVAIKVLRRDLVEDDKALSRLFAEARAAAKIRSEHVARVLDVGTLENGAPFIVMEYLEGEDLADLLDRQGALDVTMAVQFMLQSCEALAEVHAAEMVHRDLKPGNLFVAKLPDGSPSLKIVDFGISKNIGGSARHHASTTTTSTVLGSPYYMPPEQMRAEPVDERSDIWSLGAILFEMLTGRPQFLGDTLPEVYAAVLSGTVQSVSSLRPDIPQGLDDIVQRCLDKDPQQRFEDVAELAEALRPYGGVNSGQSVERVARILNNPELFRGRPSATPRAGAVEPVSPGGVSTARGGMSLEPSPLAPSPMLDIGPGSVPQAPTMVTPELVGSDLPRSDVPRPDLPRPGRATPGVVTPGLVTPGVAFGRRTGSNSPVELSLSSTSASNGAPFTELAPAPNAKRGVRAAWGAVAFAVVVVGGALWMRMASSDADSGPEASPLAGVPSRVESEGSGSAAQPVAAPPPVSGSGAAAPAAAAPKSAAAESTTQVAERASGSAKDVTEPKAAAARPPVVTVEALRPAAPPPAKHVAPPPPPPRKAKPLPAPTPARAAPTRATRTAPRASSPRAEPRPPPPQNGSASSKQKGSSDDPWNPSSFGDRH